MRNQDWKIRSYVSVDGKDHFTDWILSIRDLVVRARIRRRIDRFQQGNFGDYKSLGEGVYEARFHFGAGYRVYFGLIENALVILLCGGDKSSQVKDIKLAKHYWIDLRGRTL